MAGENGNLSEENPKVKLNTITLIHKKEGSVKKYLTIKSEEKTNTFKLPY